MVYVCPYCGTPAEGASECRNCGQDLDSLGWLPTKLQYDAGQSAEQTALGPTPVGVGHRSPPPPATPLKVPARWVVGLIVCAMVADAISVVSDVRYLGFVGDLIDGVDVSFEDATAIDDLQQLAGILQLVAAIAAGIAFIVWFRRAYRNLPSLGFYGLRFTEGWAIGAWFVPFLNWVRPKAIANDIWRASDPSHAGDDGARWGERPVAAVVHLWWALWLISSWGAWLANRLLFRAETLADQQSAASLELGADAMGILSGIVAIVFVRALTARQDTLIAREAAIDPERVAELGPVGA